MKIGMTSLTFRKRSIEEVFEIAEKCGVQCIEWGVSDDHAVNDENIEKIKKLSAEYGIETCSLGSYCNLENEADCIETLNLAIKLSAPAIRVWAGEKSPAECDKEYFDTIVRNTRKMADKAAEQGLVISFEYHNHSLTETPESALNLLKSIDRENVKTHWQPSGSKSTEENKAALSATSAYLSGIFHVHNYKEGEGYLPLCDIKDRIKAFFEDYKNTDFCLLVEFTKDSSEENFINDIDTIRSQLITLPR